MVQPQPLGARICGMKINQLQRPDIPRRVLITAGADERKRGQEGVHGRNEPLKIKTSAPNSANLTLPILCPLCPFSQNNGSPFGSAAARANQSVLHERRGQAERGDIWPPICLAHELWPPRSAQPLATLSWLWFVIWMRWRLERSRCAQLRSMIGSHLKWVCFASSVWPRNPFTFAFSRCTHHTRPDATESGQNLPRLNLSLGAPQLKHLFSVLLSSQLSGKARSEELPLPGEWPKRSAHSNHTVLNRATAGAVKPSQTMEAPPVAHWPPMQTGD